MSPFRYLSLDIETTGLNPELHRVLQIGMVLDDFSKPLEEAPRLSILVDLTDENVLWQAPAMVMNIGLAKTALELRRSNVPLDVDYDPDKVDHFCKEEHVLGVITTFLDLYQLGKLTKDDVRTGITVAGKNVLSFDVPFLNEAFSLDTHVRFRHRALDPAALYFDPLIDDRLPDLKLCNERAGLPAGVAHEALPDALNVCKLLRLRFLQN